MEPFEVIYYQKSNGLCPFEEWLLVQETIVQTRIDAAITALRLGSLKNTRAVGDSVYERKIDFGPGYRIYYKRVGQALLIIFCAGDKSSQDRDIKLAKQYAGDGDA